jgi:hypothetical protein
VIIFSYLLIEEKKSTPPFWGKKQPKPSHAKKKIKTE